MGRTVGKVTRVSWNVVSVGVDRDELMRDTVAAPSPRVERSLPAPHERPSYVGIRIVADRG